MIPRFKPTLGRREALAAVRPVSHAVERFEGEFAEHFEMKQGIAFAYGRTALFALCRALGLTDADVIMPAYTCSVVAYAVTLSGNTCRFVDISLRDYNMDPGELERAIGERTRMVVATHLFGFPADVTRLAAIVSAAERKYGHKIWVVQDCAHAFGARWQGVRVCRAGDVALFGLGVSKMMTSISGGILTTDDEDLARRVREWRDAHVRTPSVMTSCSQGAFLAATAVAFSPLAYGFVRWLESETHLLDELTRAYHMDGQIRMPPDHLNAMSGLEARIGLAQLAQYDAFEQRRQYHARAYHERLRPPPDWIMPPRIDGATYSHFPIRVPDREQVLRSCAARGIQLGQIIDYSVPHLREYAPAPTPERFPNSWLSSQQVINLPVHPGLADRDRDRIVTAINQIQQRSSIGAARTVEA